MADFEVGGAADIQRISAQMQHIPAELKIALKRRMKDAAEPMKTAAQRSILATPTHGEKHTGLRAATAAATTVSVRTLGDSVNVRVGVLRKSRMPPGKQGLPGLIEGGGWQHEVFGHPWKVFQRGHRWFEPAWRPLLPGMYTAVNEAVNDATRTIR